VYLNADCLTEDFLKDDRALSLDANFYGDVAMFITMCNTYFTILHRAVAILNINA
jgi:hypothetical protein